MKININKNIVKKGLLFAGLTLTFATTPGCTKTNDSREETTITVQNIDELDNNELSVIMSEDTQRTLEIYNNYLETIELNVNDLEVLSQYNVPMMVIKGENGNYSQVGDDYYIAITSDSEIKLLCSHAFPEQYDMFTGEKLEENIELEKYTTLTQFIVENNINYKGYALPTHVAYSDKDKQMIENIYGSEVLECIKENGIPLKVYEAKDFYEAYENNKQETKIKR